MGAGRSADPRDLSRFSQRGGNGRGPPSLPPSPPDEAWGAPPSHAAGGAGAFGGMAPLGLASLRPPGEPPPSLPPSPGADEAAMAGLEGGIGVMSEWELDEIEREVRRAD